MTTVAEANAKATDSGRFRFVKKLGSGGFGTVFLANDKKEGKQVAIKCIEIGSGGGSLLSLWSRTREQQAEAKKEAELLMKLRHGHILGFLKHYGYQDARGHIALAIVTDFCEKGDLHEYLKSGNWPDFTKRLHWFEQLADGLTFLHGQNVAHRDIKPKNILVTKEEALKIADVGLAKPLHEAQSYFGLIDKPFEMYMSSVAGTSDYMAPEVWAAHYEQKSDVFSLGLVFVVMTEKPPSLTPVARWGGIEYPLGVMYHRQQATRSLQASQLMHMSRATPNEVKLFDGILVCDYHERLNAQDVLKVVQRLERAHGVRSQIHTVVEPPAESFTCSCRCSLM